MAHPLYVDQDVLQDDVKRKPRNYCIAHGMVYNNSKGESQHIPFTLFPSPFTEKLFTAVKEVQRDFNLLLHEVSQDYEFTENALLR